MWGGDNNFSCKSPQLFKIKTTFTDPTNLIFPTQKRYGSSSLWGKNIFCLFDICIVMFEINCVSQPKNEQKKLQKFHCHSWRVTLLCFAHILYMLTQNPNLSFFLFHQTSSAYRLQLSLPTELMTLTPFPFQVRLGGTAAFVSTKSRADHCNGSSHNKHKGKPDRFHQWLILAQDNSVGFFR